jgi:putative ABC transport system permease protein
MLAAFAVIALINILVVMTSGRRREFAQMRLLGATRSQVVRILVWECPIVTLIAGIVGGALTTVHLAPLSQVMRGSWLPDISWAHAAGLLAIALVLTLAATLVPARRSLRIPPIELMRRSD